MAWLGKYLSLKEVIKFHLSLCKEVVPDSPGLVDFAIGLVIFWGEIQIINPANQKGF